MYVSCYLFITTNTFTCTPYSGEVHTINNQVTTEYRYDKTGEIVQLTYRACVQSTFHTTPDVECGYN